MKHSSGRARSAATLAATAFGDVVGGVTFEAARALAWRITVVAALAAVPAASAFAQKAAVMPQGPAVRDNTPEIDASIAQKNWQAALTQLDARVAANPRDAQAKFKRANVLVHLNRDDEAITAFTELTQLYPELPEPYNNLATLFARQGRLTEARAALEMATQVNPNYGLAFENLGDLYLRLADAAYRRAESLGKASPRTAQRLADIQKVVSPAAPAAAASQPAAEQTTGPAAHPTSNITESPSFQFGGPNGSLAMPPYMAPSR
ncbi:tetratricopeptide (TPR) repeat protein [Paraburkholderia youngii]|uniref:tetratricopeptide repeat protein n=1 Tax=Paraburkholderia TaxID=1822464 RepID=UPI001590BBEC|nr:tetratricopeptide repeat protein [Paraburkholderia youngii]NUX58574.1 tetratricopeptide repeat protein [Paraburkholderia youngii]NVH73777.1 tetratricopeptide repeat protein [Paraburkholderia youngii]